MSQIYTMCNTGTNKNYIGMMKKTRVTLLIYELHKIVLNQKSRFLCQCLTDSTLHIYTYISLACGKSYE